MIGQTNGSSPSLEDVRSVLEQGEKHPVLLYIPARKKGPVFSGWPKITYEQTQDAHYQKLLREHPNTGVLLGEQSGDLEAIDLDTEASLEAFLALNPALQATLRSRGARGAQLFAYFTGPRPRQVHPLKVHKDSPLTAGMEFQRDKKTGQILDYQTIGEFRAEGGQSVVRGIHPSGCDYTWLVASPPITIAFEEIRWPADIAIPWESERKAGEDSATDDLLKRAIAKLSVDWLWNHFGFPERGKANPTASPLRTDNTQGHPSFSIYDEGRRFKDHNSAYSQHRGDSFDFYQLATGQDSHQAFKPFVELAGLGHELQRAQPQSTVETPEPIIDWSGIPTNATGSQYDKHKAVYPSDSILEDYMAFVRAECESADAFIIGSILPVCAAQLARRVRFPWGSNVRFPNLFAMLAGPAGDRKSSAIEIARSLAKDNLADAAFLPVNFSPESLFDEYDSQKGGRPDKLWIVDDANIVLTDWRQTGNGDRVATRFLSLYDCGALTENFRRNKEKNQPVTKRTIPQTSTSIIFGGTFNVACFQGQAVRVGIARRFIFYVAEGFGRTIEIPELRENGEFEELSEKFSRLNAFSAVMSFSPEARDLWLAYQNDNRVRKIEADQMNDAECSRIASEPMQTLAIAMIFQAAVCAKQGTPLSSICAQVLQCAIDHMALNLQSARFLDSIANRESACANAEILLAKIRKDFQGLSRNGTIFLRRTDITCKYAPHSSRQGAWTPNDIFLKFMPILIRQGNAQLSEKKGKTEVYAIRDQD